MAFQSESEKQFRQMLQDEGITGANGQSSVEKSNHVDDKEQPGRSPILLARLRKLAADVSASLGSMF